MNATSVSRLTLPPGNIKFSLSITHLYRNTPQIPSCLLGQRPFSNSTKRPGNWLLPSHHEEKKSRKGRPHVATGGSSRGTTIMWGDFGLRLSDHHRRIPSSALKIGEDAIKVRLKGMKYRLYKRVCANIGVYTKGNEV